MAKLGSATTKPKVPRDKVVLCKCGTEPVLRTIEAILTKDKLIEYTCPNCGTTSMVRWTPAQTELAIATWNQLILLGY